jgi:uncharacterized membrane protein
MEEENNLGSGSNPVPEASYSGSFGHGWEMMKKHFVELLLVILLQILLSLPFGLVNGFTDHGSFGYAFFTLFNIAYMLLVMAPVSYGSKWVFLKAVRGESFKAYEIFYAFQMLGNVILANILVFAIVGIGFVLLIVPGIIFACKLAFVPYLVTDQKMDAVEAIKKSWEMTRGFSWTIFGMGVMSFFIALAGLICLVVGIFPAAIWISCAFASLYWTVSLKQKTVQ